MITDLLTPNKNLGLNDYRSLAGNFASKLTMYNKYELLSLQKEKVADEKYSKYDYVKLLQIA